VSRRRKIAFSVIGAIALLIGAATLWQSGRPEDRYAHVLLLDPKTGETVHRQILDGGYAIAALLPRGRVAVATMDSCLDGQGGSITVFDATLEHVLSTRSYAPCGVARLDSGGLRKLLGVKSGPAFGSTIKLGEGRLFVQSADKGSALNRLTVYDAAGETIWTRTSFGGPLGSKDARDGRIAITSLGQFTPGSD
jgi:hypothetical protein